MEGEPFDPVTPHNPKKESPVNRRGECRIYALRAIRAWRPDGSGNGQPELRAEIVLRQLANRGHRPLSWPSRWITHIVLQSVRIYDTFLFDGELDLLDHRLRQNLDATDVFVLIEAAETYRGRAKPLVFAENRERFAWAAHKIRAIQLNSLGTQQASARARAEVQRNVLLMALQDAHERDVILILDADEIPSLTVLEALRTHGLTKPCRLEMTRHYQRLNLLAPASTCCVDPNQPFAFAAGHPRPESWNPGALWSGRSGVAAPFDSLKGSDGMTPFRLRFGGEIEGGCRTQDAI